MESSSDGTFVNQWMARTWSGIRLWITAGNVQNTGGPRVIVERVQCVDRASSTEQIDVDLASSNLQVDGS